MGARWRWGWAGAALAVTLSSAVAASAQAKPPKEAPAPPFWGKVSAEKVNIRMAPNKEGTIIRMAKEGESLLVVGKEGKWYQVAAPENAWCWIRTAAIKKTPEGEATAKQDTALRIDSRNNAPELGSIAKGAPVKIFAEKGEWTKIQAPKSVAVYVNDSYVDFERAYDPQADGPIEASKPAGGDKAAAQKPEAAPAPKPEEVKRDVENLKARFEEIQAKHEQEIKKLTAPPAPAPDKPDAEGFLDTVGLYIGRPGTHKLMQGQKTICYLKSGDPAKINLDAYYDRYVGVRGKGEPIAGLEPLRVITVESIQAIAPQ